MEGKSYITMNYLFPSVFICLIFSLEIRLELVVYVSMAVSCHVKFFRHYLISVLIVVPIIKIILFIVISSCPKS